MEEAPLRPLIKYKFYYLIFPSEIFFRREYFIFTHIFGIGQPDDAEEFFYYQ